MNRLRESASRNLVATSDERHDRMVKAWRDGKFDLREFTAEVREKIRRSALNQFATKGHPCIGRVVGPETREKLRRATAAQSQRQSNLELRFGDWLESFGLEISAQRIVGYYRIDFAVITRRGRFAIEVDGCYFHGCRECGLMRDDARARYQRERDARKTKYLTEQGWVVLRIPEHLIKEFGPKIAEMIVESIRSHGFAVAV